MILTAYGEALVKRAYNLMKPVVMLPSPPRGRVIDASVGDIGRCHVFYSGVGKLYYLGATAGAVCLGRGR